MKIKTASEASAIVLQMQNYSIHDGDGVRTTVFLAGCRLRCRWCANPESWTVKPKLVYHEHLCNDCDACAEVCEKGLDPRQRETLSGCNLCADCVSVCPGNALETVGQTLCVSELITRVKKELLFFRYTGGGVTFSGGEPFLQAEFLNQVVPELEKLGIGIWAETCGLFELDSVKAILNKFDHIFFDLKQMDSATHKEVTGRGNESILSNAKALYEMGIPMTIRLPLIPSVNDDEKNLSATAAFMKNQLPGVGIEILPYHELGKSKYIALGMQKHFYSYTIPTDEEVDKAYGYFEGLGIKGFGQK